MLTGVETAGVVLAAFPIVVQLIKGYKEGCQPMKSWFRFYKTFRTLHQDIRMQDTKFYSNIRKLLLPLVDSDEELETLLASPGGPAWHNDELEDALQRKLLNSYSSYQDTVERIQDTLAEFQKQLGISKEVEEEILQKLSSETSSAKTLRSSKKIDWNHEWSRIKISWARKELLQLIEELDRLNNALERLLSDGEKLNVLEQDRKSRKSNSIQQLRNHAQALYSFLSRQWPCSCNTTHDTRVFLRHKPIFEERGHSIYKGTSDYSFEISLAFGSHNGATYSWSGPVVCALEPNRQVSYSSLNTSTTICSKDSLVSHGKVSFSSRLRKTVTIQEPPKTEIISTTTSLSRTSSDTSYDSALHLAKQSLCTSLDPARDYINKLGPFIEGESQLYMIPSFNTMTGPAKIPQLATLAELMSRNPHGSLPQLPMPERIRLAVDLASSFFYIFSTPWYTQDWGKEQVTMTLEESKKSTALVERRFPSKDKSPPVSIPSPKDAFMRLCICLEELCFGQALESLPVYLRYCDPNGKPHDQTSRAATQELVDQVESQLGFCYYDAVRKCLAHSLLADSIESSKPEFWQKAHDDIVEPLTKVLQVWVS